MLHNVINGISLGSIYALIAVGFALVFNVMKFSNFSQGSLMTVSAYMGYMGSVLFARWFEGVPLFLATLATAVVSGMLLAAFIERLAFSNLRKKRSDPIYYFISSITMGILLENMVTIFASSNFYSYPNFFPSRLLPLMGMQLDLADILTFALSLTFLGILLLLLYRTKLGLGIRVVCYDIDTVQLMGINPNRMVVTALMISGALGGVGGVFLGMNYTLFPQLGQIVVKGFVASVVGGLGSILGAVVGALLLGVLEIFFISSVGAGWAPVFIFGVMLIFLLLRPQGIAGVLIQEKV